jgi:arylsulfatase A-like enzyme
MKPYFVIPLLLALTIHANAAKKPNVVLILMDDISHYSVSAYGAESIHCDHPTEPFENVPFATPRMDRLAEEGVRQYTAGVS